VTKNTKTISGEEEETSSVLVSKEANNVFGNRALVKLGFNSVAI